jgi:hypothetical protein
MSYTAFLKKNTAEYIYCIYIYIYRCVYRADKFQKRIFSPMKIFLWVALQVSLELFLRRVLRNHSQLFLSVGQDGLELLCSGDTMA